MDTQDLTDDLQPDSSQAWAAGRQERLRARFGRLLLQQPEDAPDAETAEWRRYRNEYLRRALGIVADS